MKHLLNLLGLLVMGSACSLAVISQTTQPQDDEDFQSWNDISITIPVSKRVDLSLQTTARFTQNVSRFNEARVGAGLSVKLTKAVSVSNAYTYIESRNSSGAFRIEHRYSLRGTYKFPTKSFGLVHRSTYEYRGRSSGNSWRYRAALTFEKGLPEKVIPKVKIFITEEPFYMSTTRKFSRNRFTIGINKVLTPKLSLDIYYVRQNDGFSHPGDLNVIGTSWKIKL
ncbi:MAG: DUF2490 domain-containing protein [Pyrinomonadaceae bacterium]